MNNQNLDKIETQTMKCNEYSNELRVVMKEKDRYFLTEPAEVRLQELEAELKFYKNDHLKQ